MLRHNGRDTDVWTLCASACSSAPWWAAGPSRPDVGACEFCMLCCSRARAMSAVAPKAVVRRASSPCFASLMARLSWRRAPIADARAEVGRSPTSASCVRSPASITATFWPTSSRTPTCPCWGPAAGVAACSRHHCCAGVACGAAHGGPERCSEDSGDGLAFGLDNDPADVLDPVIPPNLGASVEDRPPARGRGSAHGSPREGEGPLPPALA